MTKPPLYQWQLAGLPPQQVADMVRTLPQPVQTWAGRLVWWDRYAVMDIPAPMFMIWVRDRITPEPDAKELANALMFLGYTEHFAKLRACGGDKQTNAMNTEWNDDL